MRIFGTSRCGGWILGLLMFPWCILMALLVHEQDTDPSTGQYLLFGVPLVVAAVYLMRTASMSTLLRSRWFHRSTIVPVLVIICALVCVGKLVLGTDSLSDQDLQTITIQVRQKTMEPILSVRPMPRWRVHVVTGKASDEGLNGEGHQFYLRRGWEGWRIYASGRWDE